ncbi:MAG: Ankyrin [Chthonomonadales bacterium]|nr:Ankyrin [Chthonomonadales bacterium]
MKKRWIVIGLICALGILGLCLAISAEQVVARHFRKAGMNTDLLNAIKTRDTAWAQNLLEHGADIEVKNHEPYDSRNEFEDEFTPLALSIVREDVPTIKMLLTHGANVHATTKSDGNFPARDIILDNAAKTGNIGIVTLLLNKGAKVDATAGSGVTPLMMATSFKHPKMVVLLLQQGADVNAKDDRGFTPLHFVLGTPRRESKEAHQNRLEIIHILKKAGAHL